MKLSEFKLERYFGKHEFNAKYLLSASDCDGFELNYVLEQATKQELSLWNNLKLGYTESEGNPLLREAILQYYNLESIENVVVASPGELNFISMNLLLDHNDHAIVVTPCYQSLSEVIKSLGCELSFWKANSESWEFDTKDLELLIQKNTKLIVLNFPHNPTGAYLSQPQQQEIVTLARKHGIYIFSDEMYHKLMVSDMPELPPISDIYEKGISIWGTAKSFGLAGLRIGWLVSQDTDFLRKVVAFKDYLSICNNAPSEILTTIALNHIERFIQPNIEKIQRNVAVFEEFTTNHELIDSFIPPKAGSISFVNLNIETTALEFSDNLVAKTGIMTVPAEMFEHSGKYIRVGFGRENFTDILELLSKHLHK
ncbi:MAG: aminotransferase class I/II-fold pyridoxal phosphate-dependent enzyme [Cyclobacteriaceae bacterium]